MLSACSSINRGLDAALAAERAVDREMMNRVVKHETQARSQHAALAAASDRLADQGDALQRQQASLAHLATALTGPGGLQERLADIQRKLQGITRDVAAQAGTPGRMAPPVGRMSAPHWPK